MGERLGGVPYEDCREWLVEQFADFEQLMGKIDYLCESVLGSGVFVESAKAREFLVRAMLEMETAARKRGRLTQTWMTQRLQELARREEADREILRSVREVILGQLAFMFDWG